ncbi:AT-rich interactive domain-containing protein 2-like [Oryza brachyantha]|uniref:ARID domain-containing protein n=1 Tax=Oryza brachyantha TaxID=4533 RepID=J3LVL7_ORYBR|nr:AT-rich interactive domain-containing protein 2-like [Oryza brachyantha]
MDPAGDVLSILSKLQFLGFCADLRIGDAAASDPSELFDAVLAAFLREVYPGGRVVRPLPAKLGDGSRVDLLRLFSAVRAAGGYDATSSSPGVWASAAESVCLDATLAAPVKLIYYKYLGALDRWIQRLVEARGPFLDGNGSKKPEQLFDSNGRENQELLLECSCREQQDAILKRKRNDMVGMLDWVRELAQDSCEAGTMAAGLTNGYYSLALAARKAVFGKRARRASMTNGAHLQEIFPVDCKCCMSSTAGRIEAPVRCSQKIQFVVPQPGSDINELTVVENISGSLVGMEQGNSVIGQVKYESRKHHNCDGWLFTSQQRNKIPVGSEFQAQVPQWTGEMPVNYDNVETRKWLGTKVWPPENENMKASRFCDPVGKGREDVCGCNLPGSVECVRFHVAERRFQLRQELGSAFYAWGFDLMGEEIALCWTNKEEANFKACVQLNAPSSGRNFWKHLHTLFQSKSRKELVSYYFNCFLLRRRCYQNRMTPNNIDSDDEDETEFRFLGNHLGYYATKYDSSRYTVCIESTHCMDLDQ